MNGWTRWALSLMLVLASLAVLAADETPQEKKTVTKTKDGLHFNVPPDWPIEERGGVVGPIPAEEYMARKFLGLDGRLKTLEQQVAGFDLRLRLLEEAMQEERQGELRSSGQGAR